MASTMFDGPASDERIETETSRAARLERERAMLDEAREDVLAGSVIADEDVDAWLDRFANGEPLPIPGSPALPSSG